MINTKKIYYPLTLALSLRERGITFSAICQLRRTFLTGLVACAVAGPVLADDAALLTIDQAVAKALHDGPAMKFTNAKLEATQEELSAARHSAWPSLSADFTGMHANG